MSEPMSSVEIEDVLSSIRRLVSEDLRPSHRTSPARQEPHQSDKLILTPAFRVVAPSDSASPDLTPAAPILTPPMQAGPTQADPTHAGPTRATPTPFGHHPAPDALSRANSTLTNRSPANPGLINPGLINPGPINPTLAATPYATATPANPTAAPLIPADPALRGGRLPRLNLGAEPAARVVASTLERAVSRQSQDWESEVGDPPLIEAAIDWDDTTWCTPSAKVVPFVPTPIDPAPIDSAAIESVSPARARVDSGLSEPDTAGPVPIVEPDRQSADRSEPEVVATPASGPTQAGQPRPAELDISEQILREMVRKLILAELQGTLGERMTRNVRKLVRAEIARAVSLREAE